ncbi:hypothetical protein [Massilia sp. BHUDP2]|uniref:hypothetical protein n=1 Tax=Massilia sp. BHUDP2 TaxID=3034505 RepID=UPI00390580C6
MDNTTNTAGEALDLNKSRAEFEAVIRKQQGEPVLYVRECDIDGTMPGSTVVATKVPGEEWDVPLYLAATKAAAPADAPTDDLASLAQRMAAWLNGLSRADLPFDSWKATCAKFWDEWRAISERAAPAPDTGIPTAGEVQQAFEAWATSHGGLPLDKAGEHLKTDDGLLHFPAYKFGRTEIAWRAWANNPRRAPVSTTPTSGEVEKAGWTAPDGYVLLPEAPTNAMICAIENAIDGQLVASAMDPRQMFRQDGERIYEALLEVAAPAHPGEGEKACN